MLESAHSLLSPGGVQTEHSSGNQETPVLVLPLPPIPPTYYEAWSRQLPLSGPVSNNYPAGGY